MKKKIAGKKAAGATAAHVMTKKVVTVSPDLEIGELVALLKDTRFSGFPVVDAGKPVGLISQNDVLRALATAAGSGFQDRKRKAAADLASGGGSSPGDVLGMKVRDLMTPKLVSCKPGDPVQKVAGAMAKARVHRVVVLEGGKVAGLVSATDLVRHLAKG